MSNIRIVLFYLKVEQVKIVQAIEKAIKYILTELLKAWHSLFFQDSTFPPS